MGDIPRYIRDILCEPVDCGVIQEAVDILEQHLFGKNARYLSQFLFLLYDKLGVACMARFYLQECYEELSVQSRYSPLLQKYRDLHPQRIQGHYTEYNGDYVYRFNGQEKRYGIHSFSNEIGQNLTLLITPYGALILDCGAKCVGGEQIYINRNDLLSFLRVYGITVEDIVGVLISHAHLDHYGSMLSLMAIGISPYRFFADEKTMKIIESQIDEKNAQGIRPISSFFVANQKIRIHSYDNGHILGSQLFVIRFDDQTVVYTGDFCLHDQRTVKGLSLSALSEDPFLSDGVDCLIVESTYGNRIFDILPYHAAENALIMMIDKLIHNGYKVFLPAFAVGRSQELTVLLSENYKLLLDGRSILLTQVYENLLKTKIVTPNVKYSTVNTGKLDNFDFNDIVIASSGIIPKKSLSAQYIEELFGSNRNVAIIRTGYKDNNEEAYGYNVFREWENRGGLLFDIPLSVHASYDELLSLICALHPKNIVAVHGPGITHSMTAEKSSPACGTATTGMISDIGITDPMIINRWRQTVRIGSEIIRAGGSLDRSDEFKKAFELLVRSIGRYPEIKPLLKKMISFESLDSLFDFMQNAIRE